MADDVPSKQDIVAVFKRLRSLTTNKVCFDCGTNNPTWASVTYGVFICIDCSAIHRSLGVHITFVRSTQLDTNWTWLQLRAMQCGGNANANAFFRQHNCHTSDVQQKYKSRAASLYKDKLHHQATAAMRSFGTKLHIDGGHGDHTALMSPKEKEVDFFKEHSDVNLVAYDDNRGVEKTGAQFIRNGNVWNNITDEGPSVEAALSTSPTEALKLNEPRKSTIGTRRPNQIRKIGGAKKGGLGAQKVELNFGKFEKEAQMADKRREEVEANQKIQQKLSEEETEHQMASVRLAYQDLSAQRQKQEEKILKEDPKKAEQFERLGMGFGGRTTGMSHSVASEMKTINQETPTNRKSYVTISRKKDDVYKYDRPNSSDDEFELLGLTTSGPPKYNDSPFTSKYLDTSSSSSYRKESLKNSSADEVDGRKNKSSSGGNNNNNSSSSATAQKKFGNAKSISSDQFFDGKRDSDFEHRANLAKFEGSSSISSADYFGEPQKTASSYKNYNFNTPNLSDIKDGVKDGVNIVAGRLSNIATGVMSSFQDKYGY